MGDPRVLDPRRRETYNPDYHKRNASGSPDGAPTRKINRLSTVEGSPTVATGHSSRRSSEALPTSAIDGRRPSYQLRAELRNAAPNDSPDSMGTRYEDAQSGRSTPLTTNGGLIRQQAAPAPPMFEGTIGAVTSNPIVDMLMAVGSQLTKVAATRTERDQCETRLRLANEEDANMRKHYQDFPVIKEQKENQKRIAERRLRDVEIRDDEQITVLREKMEAFAVILSPAPRVQPVAEQIDTRVVDRLSDGEKVTAALEKKLAALESRYSNQFAALESQYSNQFAALENQYSSQLAAMSTEISTLKAAAAPVSSVTSVDHADVAQIHDRLGKLENDMASVEQLREDSDKDLVEHVNGQLGGLFGKIENTDATVAALDTRAKASREKINTNFTTLKGAQDDVKSDLERACAAITKKADEATTKEALAKINTSLDSVADLLTTKAAESTTGNALDRIDSTLNDLALKIGEKVDKAFVVNTMNAATQRFDAAARQAATPPVSVHGMHPPANGPPQTNGVPSQALVRQVNDLERNYRVLETQHQVRHQDLMVKHDCLSRVTLELQRQYNNLTTEEVCTAVMAQFSTLWPYANDYNESISSLRTDMRGVQELVKDAKSQANAAAADARVAYDASSGITYAEMQTLKDQVTDDKKVATEELEQLSEKVELLSGQVLSNKDILGEGKEAVTQLISSMEFLKDDLKRSRAKVDGLQAKYLELEASLAK